MRPEKLYLADIIAAAEAIEAFVAGLDEAGFTADLKTQSAVLHQLMVVGEAAARLPDEFKAAHPEIEWRKIVAFRNVLVHAYFSIKLSLVWVVIKQDLPELRQQISKILAGQEPPPSGADDGV